MAAAPGCAMHYCKILTNEQGTFRSLFGLVLMTSLIVANAQAQARPKAGLTPVVESTGVRTETGAEAGLVLNVSLPAGLHTQSNKPRDPLLIPTILTIDPPPGVSV